MRLRHTRSRCIRAASSFELYSPTELSLDSIVSSANNSVSGANYVNASAQCTTELHAAALVIYANVNQLLDEDPPIDVADFFDPFETNGLNALDDVIGRGFTVEVIIRL